MFKERKSLTLAFTLIVLCILGLLIVSPSGAVNWQIMPPYNVLWPLWSPALSPVNAITGLPTPLVSSITKNTVLPTQPGLAWDPAQATPWAIYNTPVAFGGGLTYFDQVYGMNPWPPSYMLNPATGAPSPISLLSTWTLLLPTSLGHLEYYIPLANATYALSYGVTGPDFLNLLTAAQIWGLPPI